MPASALMAAAAPAVGPTAPEAMAAAAPAVGPTAARAMVAPTATAAPAAQPMAARVLAAGIYLRHTKPKSSPTLPPTKWEDIKKDIH